MPKTRKPRCPNHQTAPADRCSRCPVCCALRGTTPTPRKSGSTGGERNHPERRLRTRRLPSGETTRSLDVYLAAWKPVVAAAERLFEMQAIGFDPGVALAPLDGRGNTLYLDFALLQRLTALEAERDALRAQVARLSSLVTGDLDV